MIAPTERRGARAAGNEAIGQLLPDVREGLFPDVSAASGMLPAMIFSVRVDYESTMGEVGRVLRAVDEALGDQGIVWASSEDTIQGRSDPGFEPAAGYALVEVEAPDREAAHELVGRAVQAAGPDQEVIVGGDLVLTPISTHSWSGD